MNLSEEYFNKAPFSAVVSAAPTPLCQPRQAPGSRAREGLELQLCQGSRGAAASRAPTAPQRGLEQGGDWARPGPDDLGGLFMIL